MGLPETDPIILRAQEIWNEEQTKIDRDRDIIATVVYNEAWGGCSDRHRELVAAVVVNRSQSPSWPPTIADVVSQRGQYLAAYAREDSKYQKAARKDPDVWKHCQEIASKAMSGEVDCPESVVFQANFRQGSGTYEVHTTSYSKSYFCYG
jgi:spore germination cell wall hydrolase CwlJ-like protein